MLEAQIIFGPFKAYILNYMDFNNNQQEILKYQKYNQKS